MHDRSIPWCYRPDTIRGMTIPRTQARPRAALLWIGAALLVLGVLLAGSVVAGFGLNLFLPAGVLLTLGGVASIVVGAVWRRRS